MKANVLLLLSAVLFLSSCAKEREIEVVKDPERDNIIKSSLIGKAGKASPWIYKTTVVKTSGSDGFAFVGFQNNARIGYFNFTKSKLKIYKAYNIKGQPSHNMEPTLLNEWDVSHYDKKLSETDGKVAAREVEDNDKTWNQKRYFKIDFAKANVSEAGDFPYTIDAASKYSCWSKSTSHLVDNSLEMSADYLSFVVSVDYKMNSLCNRSMRRAHTGEYLYTVHYRYSFKKYKKTAYKPYVYRGKEFDPMIQTFGFFKTNLLTKGGEREIDEHHIFMNRWDPNKDHNFYFVKGFPKEYKWIFNDPKIGVIAKTNALFKKKGLKLRLHIHDNDGVDGKEKKFGDIRYSFINFITHMDGRAPFGYGPSDADPFTGEIFASNTMVYTGYMDYYLRRVNGTVSRLADGFEDSSLFNIMKDTFKSSPSEWKVPMDLSKNAEGDIFQKLLQKKTYGYPYWAPFTAHGTEDEASTVFRATDVNEISRLTRNSIHSTDINKIFEKSNKIAANKIESESRKFKHDHISTTVYPLAPVLAGARKGILAGEDLEEVKRTILYRVSIHEFGHNLGLRHNFYGSVDKKNFPEARKVIHSDATETVHEAKSSSVMDYQTLKDEMYGAMAWEPYDEAALSYAYSDGKVDLSDKKFMYCTDEHRPLNAMCGTWDSGSTPMEVLTSLIEGYEDTYSVINFRDGRTFWNTGGYSSYAFGVMWDIKKFLLMWRTDYTKEKVLKELKSNTELSDHDKEETAEKIDLHMKETVKLSMAFYNAVIQQSAADRPWRDQMDIRTGSMKRIGILYDKVFAMRFLVGDEGFMYNPNSSFSTASYLTYMDHDELRPMIETLYENSITSRVDMDTWFLSYSRVLFALNATNYNNIDDHTLINKIKVKRYTAKEMKENFGIVLTADSPNTQKVRLTQSEVPFDYTIGEEIGFTGHLGYFYVVSKVQSPYAWTAMQSILDKFGDSNVVREKNDVAELYNLYNSVLGLNN